MAYKFQMGHADMSGSLTQLGAMVVSGTLSASAAISGVSLSVDADVTAGADVILSENGYIYLTGDGGSAKIVSTGGNNVSINGANLITNGAAILPDADGGTALGSAAKQFSTSFQSGLASLDGGINVNDLATISAAGVLSGSLVTAPSMTLRAASISTTGVLSGSYATTTYMTASAHVSASYFFGDGAGLKNISSDSVDVADSSANSEFRLIGVAASGDGVALTTMDTLADLITMNASTGQLTLAGPGIKIGDADVTEAEFEFLDGATAGSAVASKALVVDASSDIDSINDISAAGLTLSDLTSGRLVLAGTLGVLEDNSLLDYSGGALRVYSKNGFASAIMTKTGSVAVLNAAGNAVLGQIDNGGAFDGQGGTFAASVTVSGSSDTGLQVTSIFDGGMSIGAVGHINVGPGSGDFEIILNSNGNISGSGNLNIGGSGDFAGGLFPLTDDSYDLGEAAKQWKDLYIDGVAYIDDIDGVTADFSSTLTVGGVATFQVVDNVIAATAAGIVASDHLYFDDGASVKKVTMGGIGGYLAGGGLVADGDGVISLTAYAAPQGIGDANYTLVAGVNYGSASLTADRTWTLPSGPDIGDRVVVKAPGVMNGNQIVIQRAGAQFIDGGSTSVNHDSALGAVELIYVASDDWRIV